MGEAEPVEEEEVKEDEPKYKMRKDLREVLAKARARARARVPMFQAYLPPCYV